jgi:hypothetical protein
MSAFAFLASVHYERWQLFTQKENLTSPSWLMIWELLKSWKNAFVL